MILQLRDSFFGDGDITLNSLELGVASRIGFTTIDLCEEHR
jgi:hypothetical protein